MNDKLGRTAFDYAGRCAEVSQIEKRAIRRRRNTARHANPNDCVRPVGRCRGELIQACLYRCASQAAWPESFKGSGALDQRVEVGNFEALRGHGRRKKNGQCRAHSVPAFAAVALCKSVCSRLTRALILDSRAAIIVSIRSSSSAFRCRILWPSALI